MEIWFVGAIRVDVGHDDEGVEFETALMA